MPTLTEQQALLMLLQSITNTDGPSMHPLLLHLSIKLMSHYGSAGLHVCWTSGAARHIRWNARPHGLPSIFESCRVVIGSQHF